MLFTSKKKKNKKQEEFKLGYKKFKSEFLRRKKDIIILIIGTLLVYVPISFVTFIQGKILDNLIHPQNIFFGFFSVSGLYWFIGLFIFISFFWRIVDLYIYKYKTPILANEVFKDYSKTIFSKIFSYPVSFFKTQPLGKMTYALNTGIGTLSGSIVSSLDTLGVPAMMLFNLFFLFYLS